MLRFSSFVLLSAVSCSFVSAANNVTITVNPSVTYQQFDGMGFSEAFQYCNQIYGQAGLSSGNTQAVLDLLFSNTTGAGLTILRNGIGSSTTYYYGSMKSIQPNSPGSPNAAPMYDWEGTDLPGYGLDSGQLQLTKDAISRGVSWIIADAWSAPAYMKNQGRDTYGGHLCGQSGFPCSGNDWQTAYANYLVQYLKFYQQEGITIDYMGFVNEPDLNRSYPTMLQSGVQAAQFLKILGPLMQESGLTTQINCCATSGWPQQRTRLNAIQQAGVEDTLGLVTAHGYEGPPLFAFNTTKRVWQTEWADLSGPVVSVWHDTNTHGEGLVWAGNIYRTFVLSNVSAFLYWVGAQQTSTNAALILLNGDSYVVSKRLWAMAQWSRTVQRGATRVDATVQVVQGTANILTTAWQNPDGSVAVQVINRGKMTVQVELDGLSNALAQSSTVKTFLTNNDNDFTAATFTAADGGAVTSSLAAFSMMTFIVGQS